MALSLRSLIHYLHLLHVLSCCTLFNILLILLWHDHFNFRLGWLHLKLNNMNRAYGLNIQQSAGALPPDVAYSFVVIPPDHCAKLIRTAE